MQGAHQQRLPLLRTHLQALLLEDGRAALLRLQALLQLGVGSPQSGLHLLIVSCSASALQQPGGTPLQGDGLFDALLSALATCIETWVLEPASADLCSPWC